MSKKFTSAQHHHYVFELKTQGILEGLLKWEDKLLCIQIHVVTDHNSLEFFKTQQKLLVVEERDLLAAELAANAEPEPEPDRGSDEDDLTVFHECTQKRS